MIDSLMLFYSATCCWLASAALARCAPRLGMVQAVNERSSHSAVTPHGGGLAITLVFFSALLVIQMRYALPHALWLSLLGAGGLVWAVSLWDDMRPLPVAHRLGAHTSAALAAVLLLLEPVLQHYPVLTGLGIVTLATGALVWWLNLFNFMDGIDGLAASEAVYIGAAACLLIWLGDAEGSTAAQRQAHHLLALLLALLSAASAGFLINNWSPARLFMGDVGSIYLGFAFGALALASIAAGQLPASTWLILGGVFWVDATTTLVRRLLSGERLGQAHRQHAYQRYTDHCLRYYLEHRALSAVDARTFAHRAICLGIAAINLLWLLPLAYLDIMSPAWDVVLICLAWAPLLGLATRSLEPTDKNH